MKYPIEWVLEYVPVDWDDQTLAEKLTMSGSEVEHVRDRVMDVKVTPNRGDTLSMRGLAREVAALTGGPLIALPAGVPESGPRVDTLARVEIEAPDLCPRYAARVIRNVKVGPSPGWLVRRLEACGLRGINNVVDITNYVMLECGQPLHAFDYELLHERRIIVRRAHAGETLTTIDDEERALPEGALVIADADRAVAVAGVMGGKDSEISDETTSVLLESASFQPLSVRRTAKALGMSTDSSYRFERGVDPNGVVEAANRAAALMAELAGGEVAEGVLDVYPAPVEPRALTLRPDRCNLLLGTGFTPEMMTKALESLGFEPRGHAPIHVTVPTYRADILREDDLAEEVARMIGYDLIPAAPPHGEKLNGGPDSWIAFRREVHDAALSCGWQEVATSTLVDDTVVDRLGAVPTARLSNPLSRELDTIRPSLLPGLVDAARRNARMGRVGLGLFEIGRIYGVRGEGTPWQDWSFAAAMMGPPAPASWTRAPANADFFTLKGLLNSVLGHLRVPEIVCIAEERKGFHPYRAAALELNGHRVGFLGELHPDLASEWDLPHPLVLFEISVPAIHHARQAIRFTPLPRFPSVVRDVSFVVERNVLQARMAEVIRAAATPLLRDLVLFDVFRGERLGVDHQSLAYHLTLRHDDHTLSDAEATEVMDRVRTALVEKVGASFR